MSTLFRYGKTVIQNTSKLNYKQLSNYRGLSTVAENTIKVTFIDRQGNRATVPAKCGSSLLEVANLHNIDIEGSCYGGGYPTEIRRTADWVETTFGEGPTCFYCHVQIPSSFNHLLPEITSAEKKGLEITWEEEYSVSSRLACLINLEKKHDGLIVFVPDAPPTDIL